jgi:cystathionine beta-lyase
MKKETKLIHKGRNSTAHQGTVNPPIYQSSTIIFPDNDTYQKAEEKGINHYQSAFKGTASDPAYGISGTETSSALQEVLMEIEEADYCFLTPSGLSAITLVLLSCLRAGDHLLMVDNVYGPTRRFCNKTLKSFGVEVTYYDPQITADNMEKLLQDNTKMIFLESPGSLTFEVQDIEPLVNLAKSKSILTAIDNSFATPLYFSPLDWGIDLSIQAVTKFINGNADLLMGAVLGKEKTFSMLNNGYKNTGICTAPFECYQALRGLRSLKARLSYQAFSLEKIFQYLEQVPQVKKILSPSYKNSDSYELAKKYFSGSIPLFSVELNKQYAYENVCKMIDGYKIFAVGASWGGYESLVRHFTLKSIRTATSENKFSGTLVRFYIGLESPQDIIEDLKAGFDRLSS